MEIRLHFEGFWNDFNKLDNIWVWILNKKHDVVLDSQNPNLVFTMNLNRTYPNAVTVYYSNEPYYPEEILVKNIFDFSMSNFFINSENHIRFPSYYMYIYEFIRVGLIDGFSFFQKENRDIPIKSSFCSFVSRSLNGKRGEFFKKLNEYKKVETNVFPYNDFTIPFDNSGFNSSKPKIEFIKKYKFNISFENNFRGAYPSFPNAKLNNGFLIDMGGLISEKIIEPFVSGVVPIYWGSEMVSTEFNNQTFLNYYDFKNDNELIDKIIELDNNDDLYKKFFNSKISKNSALEESYVIDLFDKITNLVYGKIYNI
jgi:hypothetical protein